MAERDFDAILVCTGREPTLPRLPEATASALGAQTLDASGRGPVPGLYVAGDARRGPDRQVGIAVGDGLMAAMHAARYVRGLPRTRP